MSDSELQRREVLRLILLLEQEGRVLSEESVRAHSPELHLKACESFGTWPAALEYAGVRLVRGTSQNVTPEQLIKRIRRRCGNLYSMRAMFVRKADYPLYRDALAMYGTWQNALAAADIDRNRLYSGTKNPKLTRDTALELLVQRISTRGVPTLIALACENQYLVRCLVFRFGKFQTALEVANATLNQDVHQSAS
jgi:hypothetical protein